MSTRRTWSGSRTRKRQVEVVAQGVARKGGQRPWHVRAYGPTAAHPNGRVRYKDGDEWVFRQPDVAGGQTLDDLFRKVESALDAQVALGRGGGRTMRALGDRYLDWLRSGGRADTYLLKVENILNKWIMSWQLPDGRAFGALPVSEWSSEHTAAIVARVRQAQLSDQRVEDVGVALSGLRHTAQRKLAGVRWLALDDNPMEGVRYGRSGRVVGQHRNYVPPSTRPTEAQVLAAVEAARTRGAALDCPWLPLMVQVATRCGLRLGELLALRACDVDLKARQLDVNGAWCQPRAAKAPYRKLTKTNESRRVPYPGSLADALANRVGECEADGWLFPRASTGTPWAREAWNDEWHRIRELSQVWPKSIPFRNARHFTATWWKSLEGVEWEDVAAWLGHDVQTCLDHYVRQSDDAQERARKLLDKL